MLRSVPTNYTKLFWTESVVFSTNRIIIIIIIIGTACSGVRTLETLGGGGGGGGKVHPQRHILINKVLLSHLDTTPVNCSVGLVPCPHALQLE